jgi:signal transduction histidine kinase
MNNSILSIKSAIKSHKNRKKIYSLGAIILLSLILSIFFIIKNEVNYSNQSKLLKENNSFILKTESEINVLTSELFNSKEQLYNYLLNSNSKTYRAYFKSLDTLNSKIGNLNFDNTFFTYNYLGKKLKIDSLYKKNKRRFKNKRPRFNYYLNNLKVDTITKIDSVKRKWLFGRLLDAVLGRVKVQKITTEIETVREFNKNVDNTDLVDQNSIQKNKFLKNKRNVTRFIELNNNLIGKIESFLFIYNKDLESFKNYNNSESEKLNKTLVNNTRLISSILLIITAIFILALFYLALHTFNIEKKLIIEKEINNQHILFKNKIIKIFSHETKTPLGMISIFSEKLEESLKGNNDAQEIFNALKYSSNSLVSISKNILKEVKQDHDNNSFGKHTFNVKFELENIFSMLNYFVKESNNDLIVKSDINTLDYTVEGDLTKIQQLFYNIIGNSNKNTDNGEIYISIKHEIKNNLLNVEFEVEDNGVGISKDDLTRVLEENYIGGNNKNREESTGLGLYLSEKIIKGFSGKLSIDSVEKVGTTLTFDLNLKIKK